MKTFCLVLLSVLLSFTGMANNITVNNATCTDQITGASPKYTSVRFDLSWENSWRMSAGPANWDAAWVFVKYKVQGSDWAHATLSTSAGDHSITNDNGTTMTISPASDGKGVFIYRTGDGTGNINLADVRLRWNYGTDGVADAANLQVQVFAIEMVYIPQGPFYIGDGNVTLQPSTNGYKINNSGTNLPYKITSENTIIFCATAYTGTDQVYDDQKSAGTQCPAVFPKGYDAFYVMKYEISQKQYMDFFNTLPNILAPRQNRHLSTASQTYRNFLYWDGQPNSDMVLTSPASGDRACNYLAYADGAAYADWAALRPMTELEYEKACRGTDNTNPASPIPVFPVNGEYPWGNTSITQVPNSSGQLTNDNTVSEGLINPTTNNANCHHNITNTTYGLSGPLRCGIFAAKGWTSDQRRQSGATYYGVMEMAGNLGEIVMMSTNYYSNSVSASYYAKFTGLNGDGILSSNGHANTTWWLITYNGSNLSEVTLTDAYGVGVRGGSCNHASTYCRTSDRQHANIYSSLDNRYQYFGMRCVRKP